MADLILLERDINSRTATVLCPECGSISLLSLANSHSSNAVAKLLKSHTCVTCKTVYHACSANHVENWRGAFAKYNRDADAYNRTVRENYVHGHGDRWHKPESASVVQNAAFEIESGWHALFSGDILKRGQSYFTNGRVIVSSHTPGHASAIVRGSSIYTVNISFTNGQIKNMLCTCPYANTASTASTRQPYCLP